MSPLILQACEAKPFPLLDPGVGLGCAGMTSQAKVLDFLDFGGTWDPSLAFVMGCGILVSGPAFLYAEREASKPLCSDCSYEKPPKHGNYPPLIFGASFFGLGWGLIGICPGPAVAGVIPYLVDGDGPGFSFGLSFLVICITWLITVAFLRSIALGRKHLYACMQ